MVVARQVSVTTGKLWVQVKMLSVDTLEYSIDNKAEKWL